MVRKSIDANTLRFLYGKSGNKCAFPDCCEPIFEDDGTLTGECCHIEAFSQGGARYNADTTVEEKNAEGNLILLCARHHKIIDTHPQEYTTERLKEMKHTHEQQFSKETRILNDKMLFSLSQSIENYWYQISKIDQDDDTGLKMEIDPNLSIDALMEKIEEVIDGIETNLDYIGESDFNFYADFKKLCENLNVDWRIFETIPWYKNPLMGRHSMEHNFILPNNINYLRMVFYELCVKVFEKLVIVDKNYENLLQDYRLKLLEFHKNNYRFD